MNFNAGSEFLMQKKKKMPFSPENLYGYIEVLQVLLRQLP